MHTFHNVAVYCVRYLLQPRLVHFNIYLYLRWSLIRWKPLCSSAKPPLSQSIYLMACTISQLTLWVSPLPSFSFAILLQYLQLCVRSFKLPACCSSFITESALGSYTTSKYLLDRIFAVPATGSRGKWCARSLLWFDFFSNGAPFFGLCVGHLLSFTYALCGISCRAFVLLFSRPFLQGK